MGIIDNDVNLACIISSKRPGTPDPSTALICSRPSLPKSHGNGRQGVIHGKSWLSCSQPPGCPGGNARLLVTRIFDAAVLGEPVKQDPMVLGGAAAVGIVAVQHRPSSCPLAGRNPARQRACFAGQVCSKSGEIEMVLRNIGKHHCIKIAADGTVPGQRMGGNFHGCMAHRLPYFMQVEMEAQVLWPGMILAADTV